jgi:phosphopantothenoylcysteine decarboxylase/phosphopantothenate--cysteine ligase
VQEEIVLFCERAVLGRPLAGKRILLTSGSCREAVDDVRILTTRSTGQMGRALALEAFRLGADVTVVHRDTFPCITNIVAGTAMDMHKAVLGHLCEQGGTDFYISAAAISDFAPNSINGKIPSGKPATLTLEPLPKLINEVIRQFHPFTIAFKIDRTPETGARAMLAQGIAMVFMNTPETMGSHDGIYTLLDARGTIKLHGTKDEIAADFFSELIRNQEQLQSPDRR